jgi:hypothetical protein
MASYSSLAAYPSIDYARFDQTLKAGTDGNLGLLTLSSHRDLSQLTKRRKLTSSILDKEARGLFGSQSLSHLETPSLPIYLRVF